jgi:hypothetical protein
VRSQGAEAIVNAGLGALPDIPASVRAAVSTTWLHDSRGVVSAVKGEYDAAVESAAKAVRVVDRALGDEVQVLLACSETRDPQRPVLS